MMRRASSQPTCSRWALEPNSARARWNLPSRAPFRYSRTVVCMDSPEMSAYHERLARESRDQRRNLAYLEGVFAFILLITTLLAWENHPRTVADPHRPGSTIVHEVSHTMGAVTYPAGVLIRSEER